jgi:hypothetical protein
LAGFVSPAEAYYFRSEDAEVVSKFYKAVNIQEEPPSIDFADLSPIESRLDWPDSNVSSITRRDKSTNCKFGVREIGLIGQTCAAPHSNTRFAEKRLRPSAIDQSNINEHRLFGNERDWANPLNLWVNRGAFALDESPTLNTADSSQNNREKSYDTRPVNHGLIKGVVTLAIIFLGAWLGVWSIVFWDSLGLWRWLVSAIGWAVMIGTIVQGLPVRPYISSNATPSSSRAARQARKSVAGKVPRASLFVMDASVSVLKPCFLSRFASSV